MKIETQGTLHADGTITLDQLPPDQIPNLPVRVTVVVQPLATADDQAGKIKNIKMDEEGDWRIDER